nr:ORF2 [Pineapple bacilliform CO virus]
MNLQKKKQSEAYKEAVEETKNLWDTAAGFVDKSEVVANIGTLTRQLNTVLYLLLNLDERLAKIEKVSPHPPPLPRRRGKTGFAHQCTAKVHRAADGGSHQRANWYSLQGGEPDPPTGGAHPWMHLQKKKQSEAYKEAVEETKNLWDTAAGFVDKSEVVANIGTLTRQLNTVLYLLLNLDERLAKIEKVSPHPPPLKDISKDLEKLQQQLSGLRISDDTRPAPRKGVPLRVFRNPFELLKKELDTNK